MTRNEQFEIYDKMGIWREPEIKHFILAFNSHYKILNQMLDYCAIECSDMSWPRITYLYYTQYLYMIYSQLCITIECLMKSLLEESGYDDEKIIRFGHNLNKLLLEIATIKNLKAEYISNVLTKEMDMITYLSENSVFIKARYQEDFEGENHEYQSIKSFDEIKSLILTIDDIFDKYYKHDGWFSVVYNTPL